MALNPSLNEIYLGNCTLYKDSLAGSIWNSKQISGYNSTLHADMRGMEYIPGTNDLLLGTDGGAFRIYGQSNDSGFTAGTIKEINNGLYLHYVWGMGCSKTDPNRIVVGSDDNSSDDLTESGWKHTNASESLSGKCDGGFMELYDYTNPNNYFSGCKGDLLEYTDPSGSATAGFEACMGGQGPGSYILQDPLNPGIVYEYFQEFVRLFF